MNFAFYFRKFLTRNYKFLQDIILIFKETKLTRRYFNGFSGIRNSLLRRLRIFTQNLKLFIVLEQKSGVFIIAAKRTPFGTLGGKFVKTSAAELQEVAAKAAIAASGVKPEQIDSVIIGNVIAVGYLGESYHDLEKKNTHFVFL